MSTALGHWQTFLFPFLDLLCDIPQTLGLLEVRHEPFSNFRASSWTQGQLPEWNSVERTIIPKRTGSMQRNCTHGKPSVTSVGGTFKLRVLKPSPSTWFPEDQTTLCTYSKNLSRAIFLTSCTRRRQSNRRCRFFQFKAILLLTRLARALEAVVVTVIHVVESERTLPPVV